MLAVLFDISALVINLITKWHRRAYWFAIATMILQILPFIYYTSIAHALYMTVIPMTGRAGSTAIPDIQISGIAIFFTVLFAGVIVSATSETQFRISNIISFFRCRYFYFSVRPVP